MSFATPDSTPSRRPPAGTTPASVFVLIPAWNEAGSIGRVIDALPADWVRRSVVADNNSTDYTGDVARKFGATVVHAPRRGYGSACLAAMAYVAALPDADKPHVVVFLDADFSDHPEQLPWLVRPILDGEADFVLGSRTLKSQPPGALMPQQVWGNRLACSLMRLLFGVRYTDLGPFRAIRYADLLRLKMTDPNYGWTVEMQIKAARAGLRIREIPVDYRPRIGVSKVSGTITGTLRAGHKILWTIFRYGVWGR